MPKARHTTWTVRKYVSSPENEPQKINHDLPVKVSRMILMNHGSFHNADISRKYKEGSEACDEFLSAYDKLKINNNDDSSSECDFEIQCDDGLKDEMDRKYGQMLAIEEGRPYQLTTKQISALDEYGDFSRRNPSSKFIRLFKPPLVQPLQDVTRSIKLQAKQCAAYAGRTSLTRQANDEENF